jgi:hypothetical protein
MDNRNLKQWNFYIAHMWKRDIWLRKQEGEEQMPTLTLHLSVLQRALGNFQYSHHPVAVLIFKLSNQISSKYKFDFLIN